MDGCVLPVLEQRFKPLAARYFLYHVVVHLQFYWLLVFPCEWVMEWHLDCKIALLQRHQTNLLCPSWWFEPVVKHPKKKEKKLFTWCIMKFKCSQWQWPYSMIVYLYSTLKIHKKIKFNLTFLVGSDVLMLPAFSWNSWKDGGK